jgi:branched-chain amino acid transport system ATP-binding protein
MVVANEGNAMSLLSIDGLSVSFSGLQALNDVTFGVEKGEIVGLIGPNGAGKSTLMNCISRICTIASGKLTFAGEDLGGRPPHDVVKMGIARTFQNVELLGTLTVRENVLLGCMWRYRGGPLAEILGVPRVRQLRRAAFLETDELLAKLDLTLVADAPVASLPFGTQKIVELGRALAARPKLLLLDEPAAGLNSGESREIGEFIERERDESGVAILLVEHDMPMVMAICDRVVVLDHGELICQGTPKEVRADPKVISSYFGEEVIDA